MQVRAHKPGDDHDHEGDDDEDDHDYEGDTDDDDDDMMMMMIGDRDEIQFGFALFCQPPSLPRGTAPQQPGETSTHSQSSQLSS